jgi:hypothetical protein
MKGFRVREEKHSNDFKVVNVTQVNTSARRSLRNRWPAPVSALGAHGMPSSFSNA